MGSNGRACEEAHTRSPTTTTMTTGAIQFLPETPSFILPRMRV